MASGHGAFGLQGFGETFDIVLRTGSGGGAMSFVQAACPWKTVLEASLVSTVAVAIREIGDKTQRLALPLAARFRLPLPIIFGILAAS